MSLSIPWTSAQLGSELGYGSSYTSAQVLSTMGASPPVTSAQVAAFNPYTPPSATPSPNSISAHTTSGSSQYLTTGSTTAEVSNGEAPFSYSWYVSGGTNVTINSPTSASTTVSATVGSGSTLSTTIDCQVTDAKGNKCWTGNVSVSMTVFSPG